MNKYSWNLTCRKKIPGALTEGIKYEVSYHDDIGFKIKADNNQMWVMTRDDIIEYFRIML